MESEASNRPLRRSKRIKRAQIPSNSSSKIPILPEEIITEILTRLPVKSLLKFRSVSKSWLALISSPQFINTHLSLSKNKEDTHHILISGSSGAKRIFKECSISSLFYDSVTQVLDLDFPIENRIDFTVSCNGLIFLADYIKYSLLWNPTTRKHKNLPDFKPRFKKNYYVIYGFGYDEFRDDYKVVGISYGSDGVEVKVYSLKSDSWTSVDYCWEILNAPGSSQKMKLYGTGLFANGKLHWDTITSGPIMRWGRNIISFDLANEKWEKMEKPSYGVGESDLWVGKLGSDLCVYSDYRTTHLGAWVMKDYGVKESWTKMFTIRRQTVHKEKPAFGASISAVEKKKGHHSEPLLVSRGCIKSESP
ncbi:F-box protein CPR1-like isoform X2 [Lycium barbarum]|uniref:F-box protein CPR1-like isoform X2 n=1 Tax=Lycium barbarum TaxID=112863 RepID=UPI00293E519F|nr:F-box protein CPR1-like isoform X2 [Lycium barbarum]